ncbi:MAG: DUF1624 domain-containing protein, partial [Myxococcales bacterium]|nr:DUF1624 domain-containing protein [Myxococcales bacterium]
MPERDESATRVPVAAPWPELDVLRGLAAIAMVANHAVATWYAPGVPLSPLADALFAIGGFAPVLFFFATGFGSGLQSLRAGGHHRYGLARKLAILVLADQFILWRWGKDPWLGVDFLTFIALSTAVVEPLRRARGATRIALSAAGGVLLARFLLAPLIDVAAADAGTSWLLRLAGRAPTPGIAYPLLPWIAIPLLGFAAGRELGRHRTAFERAPWRVIALGAALCALGAATSALLASHGFVVNRYGVMSAGYAPLVPAAIGGAAAIAVAIARAPALARAVELRGMASLAVVPLHFAVLYAIAPEVRPAPRDAAVAALVAASAALCVAAAKVFAAAVARANAAASARVRLASWMVAVGYVAGVAGVLLVPLEAS